MLSVLILGYLFYPTLLSTLCHVYVHFFTLFGKRKPCKLHVLMVSHLVWSPIERPDMHDCTHKWVNVEDFLDADLYFVFCIKAS